MRLQLVLIIGLTTFLCNAQVPPNTFKIESYTAFDLTGGYDVGSVVSFKKKKISGSRLTRIGLIKAIKAANGDTTVLAKVELQKLPEYTYDRTRTEKARLSASLNQNASIPEDIKVKLTAALNNTKKISLIVDRGRRFEFLNGSSSARRMLYELPIKELCIIKEELEEARRPVIVTEVIIYDSAKVTYDWGIVISADLAAEFKKVIGIDANYALDDTGKLTFKYTKPVITQFKYVKIKKRYKSTLRSLIEKAGGC